MQVLYTGWMTSRLNYMRIFSDPVLLDTFAYLASHIYPAWFVCVLVVVSCYRLRLLYLSVRCGHWKIFRDKPCTNLTVDPMAKSTIKAQLVSTAYCKAHWVITFGEFNECINANLSGNTLYYTRHHLEGVLNTIEFRINDCCPPIDQLKGDMWLPDYLMERQELCRCVEWV